VDLTASIISILLAYLAGSVPSAIWAGKLFHGIDIREHGSGNAGATNTIRVLGWKTGIPVLIADLAKGWLASSLPVFLHAAEKGSEQIMILQIACGMVAIAGHVFPVLAGFRGGKGVATTFGVLLALQPWLTLTCAGIFLVVLLISGYVSLSSIFAAIAFPVLLMTLFHTGSLFFKIFSVIIALALVITHYQNIKRLIRGEEKKFIRRKRG
jgi:glycerol-3-phosphate acyltransferase PlsY